MRLRKGKSVTIVKSVCKKNYPFFSTGKRRGKSKLKSGLDTLHPSDHLLRSILGNDLIIVKHLKLLRGITTHEVKDSLRTTGVLIEPVG